MADYRKNPLFPQAPKSLQEAVRREFRKTSVGRLLSDVDRAVTGRKPLKTEGVVAQVIRTLQGTRTAVDQEIVSRLQNTPVVQIFRELEHYAKGSQRQMIETLLAKLGPAGGILRSIFGGGELTKLSSVQRDLDVAKRLLEAFGHRVIKRPQDMTPAELAETVNLMRQFLWQQGYEVSERPVKPPSPEQEGTIRSQPRKTVDMEIDGRRRRVRKDHPMLTGNMVFTPESSNVYGFAYDLDERLLYVRYLDNAGKKEGKHNPGPLYQYTHVMPELFEAFMHAASKGAWVWDNLRIRGTVSGHQYDYALVGIMNDYVPRKATVEPAGEVYLPRTVHVGGGVTVSSALGRQLVRPFRGGPARSGTPNRPRTGG